MGCLCVWSYTYAKSIKVTENVRTITPQITTVPEPTPLTKINGVGTKVRVPSIPYSGKTYTKDEVRGLIELYSTQFGIDPTIPLRIAKCESNYNFLSKNKNSSASGAFQFISSTWKGTPEGKQGLSPFDADANVRAAIRKISQGGINAWRASEACWK